MAFASCLSQSVFKNYDHDENGFMSHVEFEKIAASFPFSFCVMDKEKYVFVWQVEHARSVMTSEERKKKWYL